MDLHTNVRIHTLCKYTHIPSELTQTQPRGGAVLYPHIAEGRGDEVQEKKKIETKLEELVRRG